MSKNTSSQFTATLAALDLPSGTDVPDWVHLLPAAGSQLRTFDGRGPYLVRDAKAIITASFAADPRDGKGLLIDENHALELAAQNGLPSPSRGRIVAMEDRASGIWGKVEWTQAGRALLADKSYRGISPVIVHDASGAVLRIKNAALVNYPNLQDLKSLNQETPMSATSLMAACIKTFNLAPEATEAQVLAAMAAAAAKATSTASTALMAACIKAFKLGADATEAQVLAALAAGPKVATDTVALQADNTTLLAQNTALEGQITAMQAEIAAFSTAHAALETSIKLAKAETFVDAAIVDVRPGIKPRRDYWITCHMANPVETEKTINAIPPRGASATQAAPMASAAGQNDLTAMNAEQQGRILHDRAQAYRAEQGTKGIAVSMSDAITHIKKDLVL